MIKDWKNYVQTIYQNIKASKNAKIIEQTIPYEARMMEVMDNNLDSILEADLKTQQYIAAKILGLLEFSSKPNQLQNPGMFSFTRKSQLESQNRFIYYLNDLPNLLIQSASQYSTTMSMMFQDKIVEADPHQLLELNILISKDNEEYGTSFVAIMKKLGDSQLYNHSISTQKIESKINSQYSIFNLPQKIELLALQIDHKMQELCVQIKNKENIGYSIENSEAQNMQKIYLAKGMILRLLDNLSIEVKECQFQNSEMKNKIQENLIAIVQQEDCLYKRRLENDKLRNFIVLEIDYDGEKESVEIYLSSNPIDLGSVFYLPETIKLNLHIDGSGYYCSSECQGFYPHILYDKPLRTTNQERLSLAVVINQVKVFLSSNLRKVWSHEDLFEI